MLGLVVVGALVACPLLHAASTNTATVNPAMGRMDETVVFGCHYANVVLRRFLTGHRFDPTLTPL